MGIFKDASSRTCKAIHMSGLPVPQGTPCDIVVEMDRYRFRTAAGEFELEKRKILGVAAQPVGGKSPNGTSALGGAVGGALLLGPIGAVAGSVIGAAGGPGASALSFSYESDGERRALVFGEASKERPANLGFAEVVDGWRSVEAFYRGKRGSSPSAPVRL